MNLITGSWMTGTLIDSFTEKDFGGECYSSSLLVISDSLPAQAFDIPSQAFGGTAGVGSYTDNAGVRQISVSHVFAENPARVRFRANHGFLTGDEAFYRPFGSNVSPTIRQCTVEVVSANEVRLLGWDNSAGVDYVSPSVAADCMLYIDQSNSMTGALCWMNFFAGHPFDEIVHKGIPGRTTKQAVDAFAEDCQGIVYSHCFIQLGRNDLTFDELNTRRLLNLALEKCGVVLVALHHPDGNWTSPASDVMRLKQLQINAFWHNEQKINPRVRTLDFWGLYSDANATLSSSRTDYVSSDYVHNRGNGAVVEGYELSRKLVSPENPARSSASLVEYNNYLLNGRLAPSKGVAGVVGSGLQAGSAVCGDWTVGSRSGANVSGCWAYPVRTPARRRQNNFTYVKGDTQILSRYDGFIYLCISGGVSAAAEPSYAAAVLWDLDPASGGVITDGGAKFAKIPMFTERDKLDWTYWQLIECNATAGATESIQFYQEINLAAAGITAGTKVFAECDVVIADSLPISFPLRIIQMDAGSTQLGASIDLAPTSVISEWPFAQPVPGKLKAKEIRIRANATKIRVAVVPQWASGNKVRMFISNVSLRAV